VLHDIKEHTNADRYGEWKATVNDMRNTDIDSIYHDACTGQRIRQGRFHGGESLPVAVLRRHLNWGDSRGTHVQDLKAHAESRLSISKANI
jgi:hypothetical protein